MIRSPRYLFAVAVLLGTAALAARLEAPAAAGEATFARDLPLAIGEWRGDDDPVPERTLEVLETRDVVLRRYRRDGAEVGLAVAASTSDRKVAHPPEVCMRGAGYEILGRRVVEVPGLACGAVHLDVAWRGEPEQVLYWFVSGGRPTSSYLGHQVDAALNRLAGRAAPAALVRLTARGSAEEALPLLREFARALAPALASE